MKQLLLFSLTLFLSAILNAEQKAVTLSGLPIILHSDGTWSYESGKRPDFRGAYWGDSRETVLAIEDDGPVRDNDTLLGFEDKIAGMDVLAVYVFEDNSLSNAFYSFEEKYVNSDKYIDAYQKFKGIFVEEYGAPYSDDVISDNEEFKNNPKFWGLALTVGEIQLSAQWKLNNTDIMIMLHQDDDEVVLGVFYFDKESPEK